MSTSIPLCDVDAFHGMWSFAHDALVRVTTALDAAQPQSVEAEVVKALYGDATRWALEALEQMARAHEPDEIAALLAFEQQELAALHR